MAASADKPGDVPKLVRKYSTYNLLAIDEWLVDKPDEAFKRFLLELRRDTIVDAILDRIVRNTIWIDTGKYNMRQRHGQAIIDN